MKPSISTESLSTISADWLIVGVPESSELSPELAALDDVLDGQLTRLRDAGDLTGKLAETLVVPDVPSITATRLMLVGLGRTSNIDRRTVSKAWTTAAIAVSNRPAQNIACVIPMFSSDQLSAADTAREIATAVTVGCVGPGLYQSKPKRHPFSSATFLISEAQGVDAVESAVKQGTIIGESVNLVRELVNRPAADMDPQTFAERASQIAHDVGLHCDIFDADRLKEERMGSLLAVAAGSEKPPRVVILKYKGAGNNAPVTALVGKGVTFDSGGLSLKPTESMKTMKADMAGAATVLSVMSAAARLKFPVNLLGAVGLVENMVSGASYKLGDILTARNGVTIEVLNTDAEGRLVLADVLSYVSELKVDRKIDLATLTGACVVALGEDIVGAFTNDQTWCDEVLAAARRAGEWMWQLPMHEMFDEQLKSDIADLKNVGKRWGGASTAAKFLEHFAGESPWVHLDIAGPAFAESGSSCKDSGGTGAMVRTLVELFSGENDS